MYDFQIGETVEMGMVLESTNTPGCMVVVPGTYTGQRGKVTGYASDGCVWCVWVRLESGVEIDPQPASIRKIGNGGVSKQSKNERIYPIG